MTTPIGDHRPYVLVHMAVSLDGSVSGFQPDIARFYSLASEWQEDATLVGADTILARENELADADLPGPKEGGPILAVVDSGYRVSAWNALRDVGHWSRVIALRGNGSGPTHGVEEIVTDGNRVDLPVALAELRNLHAVRRLRVDSGGNLAGALMSVGLVDEISLLVHPTLVADIHRRPWWRGGNAFPTFRLTDLEARAIGDDIVQLRYRLSW